MATISSMMDHAARRCSIGRVVGWVGSTTDTALEMKDYLNETIEELRERIEMPDPLTVDHQITGTGAEEYALPLDFLRLAREELSVYEETSTRRYGVPITSNGAWTHLKQYGTAGGNRYYRLLGDEANGYRIGFYYPLEVDTSVTIVYVSKNWVKSDDALNPLKDVWTSETDRLLYPELVVRLGVIWRFREKKGLDYLPAQAEYEMRLSRMINDSRQFKKVNMGRQSLSRYPMDIPVPDYIPIS